MGSLALFAAAVSLAYDFATETPYGFFQTVFPCGTTSCVERVSYSLWRPRTAAKMYLRLTDATGQVFQNPIDPCSETWVRHAQAVDADWEGHFGGANDGVFHQPPRDLRILVNAPAKKCAVKGEARVSDVVFEKAPSAAVPMLQLTADVYGDKPPKTLAVQLAAVRGAARAGRITVRWTDWDEHALLARTVDFPALASGQVWRVEIPFAACPAGRKALFTTAELVSGEARFPFEGPAWTAPLDEFAPAATTATDSPWGAGIYLRRCGFSPTGFARMERLVSLAARMGIGWLREELIWKEITKNGTMPPDFTNYDRIIDLVARHGLRLVVLFHALERDDDTGLKQSPRYPEAYCDALRQMVRRYRGRVAAWEICNEPNLPWPMTPQWAANYRAVLGRATQVVREEDPAARTIGCTASGLGLNFVGSLANETFDDVSVHPYRRFLDSREFLADLAELQRVARGRRAWITELGWDAFPGYSPRRAGHLATLRAAASRLARGYLTAGAASSVRAIFNYDFIDDGLAACGYESHMGCLYENGAPKPSCRALATVCRAFAVERPALDLRADGLRLARAGDRRAVWGHGDERRIVEIDGAFRATNLMGEELPVPASRRFTVDWGHPIFLTGTINDIKLIENEN